MSELTRRAASLAEHPMMTAPPVSRIHQRAREYRHRRLRMAIAACVAFAVVAGGVSWQLARSLSPFPQSGTFSVAASAAVSREAGAANDNHASGGVWQLASYLAEPASWGKNNDAGPAAGGYLSCAQSGTCYYAGTADAGSSILYISQDGGLSWTALQMPGGVAFSTALSCPAAGDCLAGGEISGHAVLLATSDDGAQWAYRALPSSDGTLNSLVCETTSTCRALAAAPVPPDEAGTVQQGGTWFLATGDAGARWTRDNFPASDAIAVLDCWTAADCVALGDGGRYSAAAESQPGVALRTTDGGSTWTPGTVPPKLSLAEAGLGPDSISCTPAGTCYALGFYPQRYNPAEDGSSAPEICATPPTFAAGSTAFPPDCKPAAYVIVSVVAVSTDKGAAWRVLPLPAHTPLPALMGISCPAQDVCWAAGSEAVSQSIPTGGGQTATNGGSAMLVGTTDGGTTWTKITFPAGKLGPGEQADALLSVGEIACLTASSCVAIGAADQGATHTPVYTIGG